MPTNLTFDRTKQRALPVWLVILTALLIIARVVSTRYPVTSETDGVRKSATTFVHWTPINLASAAALRSHRPILYEFSAEWCGPCHVLEREVFMNAALAAKINDHYIAVQVIDRQREEGHNEPAVQQLMDRYGINAFPTVIIAAADGKPRDKVIGYAGRDRFAAFIDRVR
ncbi:MAG TPA: thioredoxin fold domain-containing protein [Thermoanaerobaculia bacterium]|nr:thioredoxin fold domain-containing protein [Thermoanaerobaculia bacterium]